MNILIPHSWLLEHLESAADPRQIQELVSLSGPSIERIYDKNGEKVYDIEVTTNRVDSMSVRGIAREAAVILSQARIPSSLKKAPEYDVQLVPEKETEVLPLPKIVNDPSLNKRTICIVLDSIQRNPTPDWMAKRLQEIDMNVHDAAIDITNYVTHETGHPCHAFDYDKLMATGGEIIITEAQKGESFTTLDGETFTTVGGEVVFKNQAGQIIDLPSIKGTKNTSVDDSTKRILLLLESIDAKKVRFASMTHAIRTTAAQLMEKNVDPHLAFATIQRGVQLYQELCSARIASHLFDEFPGETSPSPILVPLTEFKRYLGLEIPKETVIEIVKSLGCSADTKDEEIVVTPPTFRPDMTIKADVVEEVARIYGYHNLPSVLMSTAIPTSAPKDTNFDIEENIKTFLSIIGWQELYTYSFVSKELALQSPFSLEDHLKLSNPLTEDKVYLRRSLIPSLQEVVDQAKRQELSVFEIANVYHPKDKELPEETLLLGMASTKDYRTVRGEIEALTKHLHIPLVSFAPSQDNDQVAILSFNSQEVGKVWMDQNKIVCEIEIKGFIKNAQSHPSYTPPPKTAQIFEDLTFTTKEKTPIGEMIEAMINSDEKITAVTLKGLYKQNATFSITYHDPEKNIDGAEIEPIRKKLVEIAGSKFSAELVGTLA